MYAGFDHLSMPYRQCQLKSIAIGVMNFLQLMILREPNYLSMS